MIQEFDGFTEGEQYYRSFCDSLLNTIKEGVVVYVAVNNGEDFIICDCNRQAEIIGEVNRADICGRKVREVFPACEEAGVFQLIKRVYSTGDPEYLPIRMYSNGGLRCWVENHVFRLPDRKVVAVFNDLTEAKRQEFAIAAQNKKLQLILGNSFSSIYQIDIQSRKFDYVNNMFSELIGIPREKVEDYCWDDIVGVLHPDDRGFMLALLDDMLAGKSTAAAECRFKHANGSDVWVKMNLSVVKNDKGEPSKLLVAALDITKIKELEYNLLNVFDKVTARFGRDLHDSLQQLLTGMLCYSKSLEKELQDDQHKLDKLKKLSGFIADAKTESKRISHGLFPVDLQKQDLAVSLQRLRREVEELFNIKCELRIPGGVRLQSERVGTNLYFIAREAAYNAAKHSGADLITIEFKFSSAGYFFLTVADNGCGYCGEDESASTCMGINVMKLRAEAIGAQLQIIPSETGGTMIQCQLGSS